MQPAQPCSVFFRQPSCRGRWAWAASLRPKYKTADTGRAKAPQRLVRPIKHPLQVGQEVPADELGPAEVCGQHERLPQEPGQHDRRPQGLRPQAAASSLHPKPQLRTPTNSPPQRRPLKQRRTHCELEQAWGCILRKLPMPFKHFCGADVGDARGGSYDSVLAGKAVSAEDHGWPSTPPVSWGGRPCESSTTATSTPTSWPWRTWWRATETPSGRSRGLTPSTTSRCPGPPGTPCCGTRSARLPFSSPTSRPTRTACHGWAELHLPALR